MLHKMYLVRADRVPPEAVKSLNITKVKNIISKKKRNRDSPGSRDITKKKRKWKLDHPDDEWIKLRTKIGETDLQRRRQTKTVANFVKQIWPTSVSGEGQVTPAATSHTDDDEVSYVRSEEAAPVAPAEGPYLDPNTVFAKRVTN